MAQSTSSGNNTVGNLLDAVWFSQEAAPAAKGTAEITVYKEVKGLSEDDAKVLLAKTDLITEDGTGVTLTDVTGSGTNWRGTYTFSNSIESGGSITKTYAEDTDAAKVGNYTCETKVDGKEGISKDVTVTYNNNSKTVTFTNTYTPEKSSITVTKEIKGDLTADEISTLKDQLVFTIKNKDGEQVETKTLKDFSKTSDTAETYSWTTDADYMIGSTYTVSESEYTVGADGKYTVITTPAVSGNNNPSCNVEVKADSSQNTAAFENEYTLKTYTVTILKDVTGNMGDTAKGFTFTANYSGIKDADKSFDLIDKDNDEATDNGLLEKEITNVPYGTSLTVTESNYEDYTPSNSYKIGSGDSQSSSDGKTCTVTVTGDTTITFTNNKEKTPDTATVTTYTPYLLAVGGAVALFILVMAERSRKRGRRNRF